jgi:hypothetical protein
MPILSQTLKGHNSETVHPFELKKFCGNVFWPILSEIYQRGLADQPVDRNRHVEHGRPRVSSSSSARYKNVKTSNMKVRIKI